jgi:hypothetical protein
MSEVKNNEEVHIIKLDWDWNQEVETKYVNHIRITHGGPEFYVYFGELAVPPFLEHEEKPGEMSIIPKVRIAVTPEQMGRFIEVMKTNYDNYLKKQEIDDD